MRNSIFVSASLICAIFIDSHSHAEVILDGSLGVSGSLAGPDFIVPDNVGKQSGANLFHSFSQFNIAAGESATFTGPDSVQNIICRVTGGNASNIDGALRSSIPGADLYLLNPSGIMFGPNAQLDVSGSFHASTADYLSLADGGRFDATDPGGSVLTAATPTAFGFLGNRVATISLDGAQLTVPTGEQISLIGGDIEAVKGVLTAPAGRVDLVSVASVGEVVPQADAVDVNSFSQLGSIKLMNLSYVDVHGDPGGRVFIRGQRFVIDNSAADFSKYSAFVGITAQSTGTIDHQGTAIDIQVTDDIDLYGAEISATALGAGDGGDIRVVADRVNLHGAARSSTEPLGRSSTLLARALGAGDSGNIAISAREVELQNGSITTVTSGTGTAGDITIDAQQVQLLGQEGFAYVSAITLGPGNAGNLTINADDISLSKGNLSTQVSNTSNANANANAGQLTIHTNRLSLTDGAQITSGLYGGSGSGGSVSITAQEIDIAGRDSSGYPSGIFANVSGTTTSGTGGTIEVTAERLTMTDKGQIGAYTQSPGDAGNIVLNVGELSITEGAFVSSSGFYGYGGNAGNVQVTANTIFMSGMASSTDPFFSDFTGISTGSGFRGGKGGSIMITADRLDMTSRSEITATSSGPGNAGDVRVDVDHVVVQGGAVIVASALGSGNGGNIELHSRDITVTGVHPEPLNNPLGNPVLQPSLISTSAGLFGGSAGDITINTDRLAVLDGGGITAQTFGPGMGGNIAITADQVQIAGVNEAALEFWLANPPPGWSGDVETATRLANSSVLASSESVYSQAIFHRPANGNAGDVTIDASVLELTDHGKLAASTDGDGAGGNISLNVDTLAVSTGGIISAESTGSGAAGDLSISGNSVRLRDGEIAARTEQSDGGNIEFNVSRLLTLTDSAITTSVKGGSGNGGNITIDPEFVVLNHSQITADAFGGDGGNISIVAGHLLASPDSLVSASSQLGVKGTIVIAAPSQEISGDIDTLPETVLDASAMFKNDCAAAGGRFSSFTVTGPAASAAQAYLTSTYEDSKTLFGDTQIEQPVPKFIARNSDCKKIN